MSAFIIWIYTILGQHSTNFLGTLMCLIYVITNSKTREVKEVQQTAKEVALLDTVG